MSSPDFHLTLLNEKIIAGKAPLGAPASRLMLHTFFSRGAATGKWPGVSEEAVSKPSLEVIAG